MSPRMSENCRLAEILQHLFAHLLLNDLVLFSDDVKGRDLDTALGHLVEPLGVLERPRSEGGHQDGELERQVELGSHQTEEDEEGGPLRKGQDTIEGTLGLEDVNDGGQTRGEAIVTVRFLVGLEATSFR